MHIKHFILDAQLYDVCKIITIKIKSIRSDGTVQRQNVYGKVQIFAIYKYKTIVDSLDGCVNGYFDTQETSMCFSNVKFDKKNFLTYKNLLDSKRRHTISNVANQWFR